MRPAKRFLFAKTRSKARGLHVAGLLLSLCVLLASAAWAAAPRIVDNAKLFSNHAVSEAMGSVERIYRNTSPHKQVDIETLATLPAGKQADELAAERFRVQSLDGVLVLIVKDPHKLAVTVGRGTEARFRDGEAVRSVMLEHFRHGDYDGGLLAGVGLLESRLTSSFAPGATSYQRGERAAAGGSNVWLWLGVLSGGALLAWLIWRLRKRNPDAMAYGPPTGELGRVYGANSPGPGNVAPAGGGGWGRAILGGAAGALAGNWLYDRFFHGGHDGSAHAAMPNDSDAPSPDFGDVGDTFAGGDGADWSDGGGGGGSDW